VDVTATPDLNALLGSRICHDLISPLGAIGNGVELLTMAGAGNAPEIALIAESVENANALIRLYRIAFGTSSVTQGFGASAVRNILADVYRRSRLSVVWQVESDCTRSEVKLAFLLLLCFETAMPWGGRISVRREDRRWSIHGSAERLQVSDDLWSLLSRREAPRELTSAQVHFALAPRAAAQLGRSLEVTSEPGLISVAY
jgi:histidine phosphotransferase ChpT